MRLRNSVALVTGASRGIGREIAKALAAEGASVAIVARSSDGLEETRELIRRANGTAEMFEQDLRGVEGGFDDLAVRVNAKLGSPDILVNVAGVWHDDKTVFAGVPLVDTPAKQILEVMEVGLLAPMLLTRAFLPPMLRAQQGKIISISGTFATGGAGWLHYYVSKLGLENFTVGLAQELRPSKIQVNCVSPSDTATDALRRFFPEDAKTALDPREVARLVVFLASQDAEHITGQCIVIKNKDA